MGTRSQQLLSLVNTGRKDQAASSPGQDDLHCAVSWILGRLEQRAGRANSRDRLRGNPGPSVGFEFTCDELGPRQGQFETGVGAIGIQCGMADQGQIQVLSLDPSDQSVEEAAGAIRIEQNRAVGLE